MSEDKAKYNPGSGINTGDTTLGSFMITQITPVYSTLQMLIAGKKVNDELLLQCKENLEYLTAISMLPGIEDLQLDDKLKNRIHALYKERFRE